MSAAAGKDFRAAWIPRQIAKRENIFESHTAKKRVTLGIFEHHSLVVITK